MPVTWHVYTLYAFGLNICIDDRTFSLTFNLQVLTKRGLRHKRDLMANTKNVKTEVVKTYSSSSVGKGKKMSADDVDSVSYNFFEVSQKVDRCKCM